MLWAETTEILGRVEKFQTGTPQLILRGGVQQEHEYGKTFFVITSLLVFGHDRFMDGKVYRGAITIYFPLVPKWTSQSKGHLLKDSS